MAVKRKKRMAASGSDDASPAAYCDYISDCMTATERKVSEMFDAGASYAEMADALGLSAKAIKRIVSTIDNRIDGQDKRAAVHGSMMLAARILHFEEQKKLLSAAQKIAA